MFGAVYGSKTWTLRKMGAEVAYLEGLEIWWGRRMQKIKWSEKATNVKVLERIGEKRALLNNILRRKANWFDPILRRNCLLHDVIEIQMTEAKRVGRRRTWFLDDLRNRKRYWEIKIEKNVETVYHTNIRKKQKLFSLSPWIC